MDGTELTGADADGVGGAEDGAACDFERGAELGDEKWRSWKKQRGESEEGPRFRNSHNKKERRPFAKRSSQ